ncbi:MAG TPA: TlpA disulfide reductase family protein [Candidatus Methanoperedens sp.]|nr:TlpA disulfide reductase family protein [Candidatus Methanoperedens sp.]
MPALFAAALLGFVPAAAADGAPSAGAYILSSGQLRSGAPVPNFHARDIYGTTICLEDLLRTGRKPLIAFWSMYCQACVQKFKAMIAVQKQFGARGLEVISVNTDGEYKRGEQEIRDFVADFESQHGVKVNFPVLYDERNWLPQAMSIEFLPTIVTVDPQSRVLEFYQKFGEVDEQDIVRGITDLAERMLAAFDAAGPAAFPASSSCPQKH